MKMDLAFVPVAEMPAEWRDGRRLLAFRVWKSGLLGKTEEIEWRVIWYDRGYGYGWETHPVWSEEDLTDEDGCAYYYRDFAPQFVAELPKGFPE